jgi:hypothetical protein
MHATAMTIMFIANTRIASAFGRESTESSTKSAI